MNKFYLSNPNLKSTNVQINYTDEQLDEYIKCKTDPIYFIKKYIKIISLDEGLINFHLFGYQEKFIDCLHNNRRVIGMFPRQMGKTTTVAAYICWYVIFNDSKTVAILANKATAAREILYRLQLMYENIPIWLQQGVSEWNKGSIALENNSKVFTAATSASGIRGKSVNLLYVDEAAIIANTVADEFFTSTYPTISAGETTKIILTSTPLGLNHFWKFWTEAESNLNGFKPFRVEYWEHPNRGETWAAEQKELLGELKYRQEVLMSFLGSSMTLISPDVIQRLAFQRPIYTKDNLDIYDKPVKGETPHIYVIVADTSKGVGGDYSAFVVIDVTELPYKVVAKYRNNNIAPMLYPHVIHKVARDYNDAYVLIEINSSEQVAYIFYNELEYENLLFVGRSNLGQFVSSGFGGSRLQYGVNTDRKVKRIGCLTFKTLIEENRLIVTDPDIIEEISTFIEVRESFAADDGYHDDLVMPLVLFSWLTTNNYFKDMRNINLRERIFQERAKNIEEDMIPTGFYNDGTDTVVDSINI
jgi:Terminase RNaseH-like domain/Terminase large subunit, T4likevirus-type, N-terminal